MVSFLDNALNSLVCQNRNMTKPPAHVTAIHNKGRRPAQVYLREWLEYRGITAEQLAGRLEVNKGQISKLMTGKQRYNQDWLEHIAYALNCDVPDLYRLPMAPTANELLARMTPDLRATAINVLIDLASARNGTSG